MFFIILIYLNCSWLIHKKPKQKPIITKQETHLFEPLILPLPPDTSGVLGTELDEKPQRLPSDEYGIEEDMPCEGGEVMLKVLIGRDGNVIYAYIFKSSGNVLLDNIALRQAIRWRFTPPKRKGEPVQVWLGAPMKFIMR